MIQINIKYDMVVMKPSKLSKDYQVPDKKYFHHPKMNGYFLQVRPVLVLAILSYFAKQLAFFSLNDCTT